MTYRPPGGMKMETQQVQKLIMTPKLDSGMNKEAVAERAAIVDQFRRETTECLEETEE
ncbi:hypothetical protein ACFL3T_03360 [Patescibacteria group bacterium]